VLEGRLVDAACVAEGVVSGRYLACSCSIEQITAIDENAIFAVTRVVELGRENKDFPKHRRLACPARAVGARVPVYRNVAFVRRLAGQERQICLVRSVFVVFPFSTSLCVSTSDWSLSRFA
jgi:hypothetical protein